VLLSKLNPRIPRIWLPANRRERRAVCSTEFLVVQPRPGAQVEFVYSLLGSASFLNVFATLVTGTSGSHQRVKPEHFLAMKTLLPPAEITACFSEITGPIFQGIAGNLAESQTLATVRDTLLPGLLSGEVRVKKIEKPLGTEK
jgi:type I restriction enzyme S subunit